LARQLLAGNAPAGPPPVFLGALANALQRVKVRDPLLPHKAAVLVQASRFLGRLRRPCQALDGKALDRRRRLDRRRGRRRLSEQMWPPCRGQSKPTLSARGFIAKKVPFQLNEELLREMQQEHTQELEVEREIELMKKFSDQVM
jgi:hypothetical protein